MLDKPLFLRLDDGEDYNTIVWGPLNLESGGTFKGKIRNVRITDTTDVYTMVCISWFFPPNPMLEADRA